MIIEKNGRFYGYGKGKGKTIDRENIDEEYELTLLSIMTENNKRERQMKIDRQAKREYYRIKNIKEDIVYTIVAIIALFLVFASAVLMTVNVFASIIPLMVCCIFIYLAHCDYKARINKEI